MNQRSPHLARRKRSLRCSLPRDIHRDQRLRSPSMNPSDENELVENEDGDPDDNLDLGPVPADLDVDEGDEEKRLKTDLPPAMPPAV
jgi:hypothetical protein